jgi:outer membrane murein-binding lipoprotein Lpp
MLEFLLVMLVLAVVVWLVSGPLRAARSPELGPEARRAEAEVAELEAERDAKYREIRDAELDRRVGKLSEPDWKALDRALRAEAVEILRKLDAAEERLAR